MHLQRHFVMINMVQHECVRVRGER